MSFAYLDRTRYSNSSSTHSPIVAVGCSHRTDPVARARAREVAEAIVSAVRYDCATWSTSMRDVEDADGWAVRDRNASMKYRRRSPDTPLTRRAGMRDRFQFLPHVDEH